MQYTWKKFNWKEEIDIDLRQVYKNEECPVCRKTLIFSNDYSEVNCQTQECTFNRRFIGIDIPDESNKFFNVEGIKEFLLSKEEMWEKLDGRVIRCIKTKNDKGTYVIGLHDMETGIFYVVDMKCGVTL